MKFEKNEQEKLNQYFEGLMIDIIKNETYNMTSTPSQNDQSDQQFFTSIEMLENDQFLVIIEMLTNHAFKHRISTKNETVLSSQSVLYAYNAVIESRYNFTEFKNLLIDSDAVVRSTNEIDQFKTFQGIDNSMHLDVSIAESISFIFGIDNTVSLKSVNLITSLRSIIFHIVSINISFLLCLADMDRLKMFFNNVINQLIQSNQTHSVICKYDHAFLR